MDNLCSLGLDKDDTSIILQILSEYDYTFYAYGSRAKGTYSKYSDLDICVIGDASDATIFEIKAKFEDSNLPIKVDLKRMSDMDIGFQKMIHNDLILLRSGNNIELCDGNFKPRV